MTYRLIHLYLKPGEKNNLKVTAKIFKEFCDRLKFPDIEYLHFNHYADKKNYWITIRYEFDDPISDKEAAIVAEDIRKQGIIQDFKLDGDQSVKKTVKIASRFASRCVYELITNHEKILEIYKNDLRKSHSLTIYFFKQLLEKIGYEFFATWSALGPYDYTVADQKIVDKFADACYEFAPDDKTVYPDPDFLERFIHLYLNCSLMQIIPIDTGRVFLFENTIWDAIKISNTVEIIAKTYKSNKK